MRILLNVTCTPYGLCLSLSVWPSSRWGWCAVPCSGQRRQTAARHQTVVVPAGVARRAVLGTASTDCGSPPDCRRPGGGRAACRARDSIDRLQLATRLSSSWRGSRGVPCSGQHRQTAARHQTVVVPAGVARRVVLRTASTDCGSPPDCRRPGGGRAACRAQDSIDRLRLAARLSSSRRGSRGVSCSGQHRQTAARHQTVVVPAGVARRVVLRTASTDCGSPPDCRRPGGGRAAYRAQDSTDRLRLATRLSENAPGSAGLPHSRCFNSFWNCSYCSV